MPYSVSPLLRDHRVGPKPTMYCVTFTPNFLAGTMCPISCSAIDSEQPEGEDQHAERVQHATSGLRSAGGSARGPGRAPRPSACSTSSTVPGFPVVAWCSLSHSSRHIGRRCRRSAGIRSTRRGTRRPAPRWRRCRRPARSRPAVPGPSGQRDGRERGVVERLERPVLRRRPVHRRGAASGTRSGQPSASAMVSRMSGGEACASVEPSVNSTIEWTIDCGWTTTSIRSYGMSNSRCASITSRPLLTSVAEFVGDQRAHVPGRVGQRLRPA